MVQMFLIPVVTDNAFKAKDIGLRAQKKILSRMASKNVAKVFIDGTTANLLDNVYKLAKQHVSLIDFCLNFHFKIEKLQFFLINCSISSFSNFRWTAKRKRKD